MDRLTLHIGRFFPRPSSDTDARVQALEAYLRLLSEELERTLDLLDGLLRDAEAARAASMEATASVQLTDADDAEASVGTDVPGA